VELPVDAVQRARRCPFDKLRTGLSLIVVRTGLPRITPAKPSSRISRSTVQRATSNPSRRSCRHTLRTP